MKRLLFNAGEYADYDYDDLEHATTVWYYDDELTEERNCDGCGATLQDNQEYYRSSEKEYRCADCIEIPSMGDLVEAWRAINR